MSICATHLRTLLQVCYSPAITALWRLRKSPRRLFACRV